MVLNDIIEQAAGAGRHSRQSDRGGMNTNKLLINCGTILVQFS